MGGFLGLIVQKDQAHIVLPLLALPDIGTEGHLICNSLVESLQSNRWTQSQVADTATPGSQLDATATQVPCIIQDQAKQATTFLRFGSKQSMNFMQCNGTARFFNVLLGSAWFCDSELARAVK